MDGDSWRFESAATCIEMHTKIWRECDENYGQGNPVIITLTANGIIWNANSNSTELSSACLEHKNWIFARNREIQFSKCEKRSSLCLSFRGGGGQFFFSFLKREINRDNLVPCNFDSVSKSKMKTYVAKAWRRLQNSRECWRSLRAGNTNHPRRREDFDFLVIFFLLFKERERERVAWISLERNGPRTGYSYIRG